MKLTKKERKRFRIKKKIKKFSNQDRFRLSVSRSAKNISAQIIDDNNNITLLSFSLDEADNKVILLLSSIICAEIFFADLETDSLNLS
jgi:large subunit ribosomal protein L18